MNLEKENKNINYKHLFNNITRCITALIILLFHVYCVYYFETTNVLDSNGFLYCYGVFIESIICLFLFFNVIFLMIEFVPVFFKWLFTGEFHFRGTFRKTMTYDILMWFKKIINGIRI